MDCNFYKGDGECIYFISKVQCNGDKENCQIVKAPVPEGLGVVYGG